MKKIEELNKKLLSAFPELKDDFEKETSWQEGINTGCTVVYEDVFMSFVIEAIEAHDGAKIKRIFGFVEDLASMRDHYTDQLIMISIFDELVFYNNEINYAQWLGPNSLMLYKKSQNNKI